MIAVPFARRRASMATVLASFFRALPWFASVGLLLLYAVLARLDGAYL